MHMTLGELWELVMDREAWRIALVNGLDRTVRKRKGLRITPRILVSNNYMKDVVDLKLLLGMFATPIKQLSDNVE